MAALGTAMILAEEGWGGHGTVAMTVFSVYSEHLSCSPGGPGRVCAIVSQPLCAVKVPSPRRKMAWIPHTSAHANCLMGRIWGACHPSFRPGGTLARNFWLEVTQARIPGKTQTIESRLLRNMHAWGRRILKSQWSPKFNCHLKRLISWYQKHSFGR